LDGSAACENLDASIGSYLPGEVAKLSLVALDTAKVDRISPLSAQVTYTPGYEN
jgi:hypothetical protein